MMIGKTIIYYFSGTGNNLWLAMKLREQLGEAVIEPIHKLQMEKSIPKEYEWVVFCVPSYYSHIPAFVKECMDGVTFASHQKVAGIVGCGGNRGMAIQDLRQCVEDAGHHVQIEAMIMMPGGYILSYGAFPKSYQKLCFSLAERKLKRIAGKMKADDVALLAKPGLFYRKKDEARLQAAMAQFAEIGRSYTVSEDCVGCGTCVKVCPVHNISIEQGKAAFGDSCAQCMACIQWCPKKAIDYQGKAAKKKYYHQSEISLQEMIQRNQGI